MHAPRQDATSSLEKRGESLDTKIGKLDKELARYTDQAAPPPNPPRALPCTARSVARASSGAHAHSARACRRQMKKMKPGPAKQSVQKRALAILKQKKRVRPMARPARAPEIRAQR